MLVMWLRSVSKEMCNRSAICLSLRPSARPWRISDFFGLLLEAVFSREPLRPLSEQLYGGREGQGEEGGTAG
jgi:hypothetical protein